MEGGSIRFKTSTNSMLTMQTSENKQNQDQQEDIILPVISSEVGLRKI